jgi:hypothetical protein
MNLSRRGFLFGSTAAVAAAALPVKAPNPMAGGYVAFLRVDPWEFYPDPCAVSAKDMAFAVIQRKMNAMFRASLDEFSKDFERDLMTTGTAVCTIRRPREFTVSDIRRAADHMKQHRVLAIDTAYGDRA